MKLFQRRKAGKASSILAAVTAFTLLLSACSSGSESSSSSSGEAGAGNRTTLKVEIFDRGNTPAGYTISDSYLTRFIQKEFGDPNNIDVKFVPVPRSEEVQKLNVLMASGSEVPDVVFTYDSGTFNRYASQGGLTELTDLLNKEGSNLKTFLGDDTLAYGQYDGQQFAVPGKRLVLGKYASYVRQDWLDALGLPSPQTAEELHTVLKAFKEKDPGKVGSGLIPMGMSIASAQYEPLIWSFIQPLTEEQRYTLTQQLGSNDYPTLLPGFKDALKYMNTLYNEGLMSADFGLDKDKKKLWEDVSNGKVGFYSEDAGEIYISGTYKNLQTNKPDAVMTPIDAFKNSEGKFAKPAYAPNAMYVMIPKTSQNAEAAMKYLDWMASGNNLFDLQYGVKDENYELVDGVPQIKEDASPEIADRIYNSGDIAIIVNGKYVGDEKKNEEAYVIQVDSKYRDDMRKSVTISNTDTIQPVRFSKPIEAESRYGNGLKDKFSEFIVKTTISKPSDFEAVYNSMMSDYMASGGQAILDERTEAYKAMK